MRAVPSELDPSVVADIDDRLGGVEVSHSVVVAWAIESGSRAWGFPSPDSDYDCRFVYVRPTDSYLSPWLARDVIETPLDHVFDVNGWDLRKAIQLMVHGNATVLEWLRSPIVYRGDAHFRDELLALAARTAEPQLLARHYAHVGQQNWERSGAAGSPASVRLKSLFYALRPAAVLHWMDLHPSDQVAPMRLQDLFAEAPPPPDVLDAAETLVTVKARTREMGEGAVPAPIRDFVESKLYRGDLEGPGRRQLDVREARAIAAQVFRRIVTGLDGSHTLA